MIVNFQKYIFRLKILKLLLELKTLNPKKFHELNRRILLYKWFGFRKSHHLFL